MKTLIKIFLTILLTSGIWSCGTRNTKKTAVKEEIKTKIEASAKTEVATVTDTKTEAVTQNDVVDRSENLTPVDPSKPMVKTVEEKDGKKITTWENAIVNSETKTDKSHKNEKAEQIIETDSKTETNFKSNQGIKKSDKEKVTESDKGFAASFWWLFLLVIPVAIWKIYQVKNKYDL